MILITIETFKYHCCVDNCLDVHLNEGIYHTFFWLFAKDNKTIFYIYWRFVVLSFVILWSHVALVIAILDIGRSIFYETHTVISFQLNRNSLLKSEKHLYLCRICWIIHSVRNRNDVFNGHDKDLELTFIIIINYNKLQWQILSKQNKMFGR